MAKKQSISHGLWQRIRNDYKNKNTIKSAKRTIRQFADWCKATIPGLDLEALQQQDMATEVLQMYSNELQMSDKSAATIHTMLAYPCKALCVSMREIQKPTRRAAAIRRGRSDLPVDLENQSRLVEFQQRVGIRRAELKKLRGSDFVHDESGYWCVRVRRGKGGKFQLQRILESDIQAVSKFFDGSEDLVFSNAEMDNKINLHAIRAQQARRAYFYYLNELKKPGAREAAVQQLKKRYAAYNRGNVESWISEIDKCSGVYYLRGDNRKKAAAAGLPESYDRLALMMVSVYHLSHWRLDVTVTNYMIP